jgi:ferric-dicitrate binding protein FerR (iron transport regulator)
MSNDKSEKDVLAERDEEALAKLLQLAGPRSRIPEDIEQRVYAKVLDAWQAGDPAAGAERVYPKVERAWRRGSRTARPLRWVTPLTLAATVLVAVGLALRPEVVAPPAAPIGTVVRAFGTAPATGEVLHVGDRIETGPGAGAAIQLADADSLRLDENTVLAVTARNRFRLETGRIYADTGDRIYRDAGLVVETELGTVTDVGTQFVVAAGKHALAVAVREGRVDVQHEDRTIVTVAGERMALTRGEEPDIQPLTAWDDSWNWVTGLTPAFDIENKSLLDVLRWAARETGRELVFADPELELAAMRADVSGSLPKVAPIEAATSVLAATRFTYRIEAARIVIER